MVEFRSLLVLTFTIYAKVVASGVSQDATATMKSVQIVFRHGEKLVDQAYEERTGLLSGVNTFLTKCMHVQFPGNAGKQEMFNLGQIIRQRYLTFISETYDPSEIQVTSSAALRCIQSGSLVAYGLYEKYNLNANWSTTDVKIPFDPIPIEVIPESMDKYLQLSNDCPARKAVKDQLTNSYLEAEFITLPLMTEFFTAYANATGDTNPLNTSLGVMDRLFPAVGYLDPSVESTESWAEPYRSTTLFVDMKAGVDKAWNTSPLLNQLEKGPLFSMLYANMKLNETKKKIYTYSSHDFTLSSIQRLFYEEMTQFPVYPLTGSAYFLEVHQVNDLEPPFLKIFYRNGSRSGVNDLVNISWCDKSTCTVTDFGNIIAPYIPQDYDELCRLPSSIGDKVQAESSVKSWGWGVSFPVLLTVAAMLLLVVTTVALKKHNSFNYSSL